MEHPREITTFQAGSILVSTIIGVGVLPLPLFAVRSADTGAPFVTLLGVIVAFFGLWVITKLGMLFPEQSIIHYSEQILGKWMSRLYGFSILIFLMVLTALTSREFGTVVLTAVLKETPLEVIVIVMLLMAAVFTRNDFNTFAYIQSFYVPIILAPGLTIVVLSLKNSNVLYLQPIFGNDPNGMMIGVLTVAALFQGSFIITMVIPAMREPEKAMKASIWGVVVSGGLYILIVIACVSVFGPEEIKNLLWPTLELARTTSLPGNILQRLDIVFLAVWVIAVFTTIFSTYMFTVHGLSKLFRLRDHKMFSFFVLPVVFVVAMLPENVLQMYQFTIFAGIAGLMFTILIPLFLLITAKIRNIPAKRSR